MKISTSHILLLIVTIALALTSISVLKYKTQYQLAMYGKAACSQAMQEVMIKLDQYRIKQIKRKSTVDEMIKHNQEILHESGSYIKSRTN